MGAYPLHLVYVVQDRDLEVQGNSPSSKGPRWIIRTMVSWKRFVENHGGKQETFTGKLETFPLFLETNLLFLETFPVQNFNYWKRFHFSWKRNHFSWKPNHRYWKRFQQSGNVSSKSGNISTKFDRNVETFPPNFWWKRFRFSIKRFLETDIEIVQQSVRDNYILDLMWRRLRDGDRRQY